MKLVNLFAIAAASCGMMLVASPASAAPTAPTNATIHVPITCPLTAYCGQPNKTFTNCVTGQEEGLWRPVSLGGSGASSIGVYKLVLAEASPHAGFCDYRESEGNGNYVVGFKRINITADRTVPGQQWNLSGTMCGTPPGFMPSPKMCPFKNS